MKRILLLSTFALMTAGMLNAAPRQLKAMKASARTAINELRAKNQLPMLHGEPVELQKTSAITVIGYEQTGFAVIANDDVMPEVLAVSDSKFSNSENPGLQWWLKAINEVCETNAQNPPRTATNVPTPGALGFETSVAPIVKAEWDQEAPYSNMAPRDKNNRRCLTGCVATAIAQVLYTHKTPVDGHGSRTNNKSYNSYQNPNGSNENVTFDYEGYTPDYENMIDQYTSGPHANQYTNAQADAVAKLMLACGVAVNMDYGSDGSGAYTDQAAAGLIQYMGITTADFRDRSDYNDTQWMTMIYEELQGGHAMYYSGVDSNPWLGGGHAFVCDGYDEQGKVHINWGWSGKDNGYYNINLLNPTSYQFSEYQDFIRGLWDPNETPVNPTDLITLSFENVEAGTLASLITEENLAKVKELTVSGSLNAEDMALLKLLAAGTDLAELGVEGEGHLQKIDLSNAVLENDEIADEAFKGCSLLRTINLPKVLARIGNSAFSGCSRLSRITSHTYEVPKMGTKVFENVTAGAVTAYFIAGSSDYYRRNAQWKAILTETNVLEFGTCIKGKNKSREYGDSNPVFGFTLVGDRVTGAPLFTCEATKQSPVGKYDVVVSQGSIVTEGEIVFVNATLTVTQAPLEVGVEDAERNQGAANPEFVLTFNGFKNDETSEVLLEMPVATTEADETSEPGEYDIVVEGGSATNYKLSYTTGKLTVLSVATGISDIKSEESNAIYTIEGIRVQDAANNGIYIKNGRKYIK